MTARRPRGQWRRGHGARPRASGSVVPATAMLASALALAGCGGPGRPVDGEWWRPGPGLTVDYLLGAAPGTVTDADVVVLDGEGATPEDVLAIHERGGRAVCYINAGAWEPYRADATAFPEALLGAPMDGWPDERWLDIRDPHSLLPLMEARVRDCADTGFDAVDFDNVHPYTQATGFPLTADDQLAYNRALADLAHAHGLAAGLKNDLEQIPALVDHFEFAVNEECLAYDECAAYEPFVAAGKPVFNIEYEDTGDRCERAAEHGLVSVHAPLALDSPGARCPAG